MARALGELIVNLDADFIIVGTGIAALRAAIDLGHAGKTIILTKSVAMAGSTGYAQGGIAAAVGVDDSPEQHAEDTVAAGDGLVDVDIARNLTELAPRAIKELIEWGVKFDRTESGELALAREGAHRCRRVLHVRDATGREISRALLNRLGKTPNILVIEDACVTDVIVVDGECVGVRFQTAEDEFEVVGACSTLFASGGAGYIFRETTNPEVATGDGIAIGYRAGAKITDMEFVQFHPTALACGEGARFLLSEALRGEGAKLVNQQGQQFLSGTEDELSSRDRVARAIAREMERTGDVYLTFDGVEEGFVRKRFPLIADRCHRVGLDLAPDRIPIVTAAHYLMGGIRTDQDGRTSVPRLFAAGEVACTGVHGANRLASNSLLEGLVFGEAAARAMLREKTKQSQKLSMRVRRKALSSSTDTNVEDIEEQVRSLLWNGCGLFRNREGLTNVLEVCNEWRQKFDQPGFSPRMQSIVTVGELVARAALRREESRGAHYRTDFPERNDIDWSRHTTLEKYEDRI